MGRIFIFNPQRKSSFHAEASGLAMRSGGLRQQARPAAGGAER
jgi:hypothetical protein